MGKKQAGENTKKVAGNAKVSQTAFLPCPSPLNLSLQKAEVAAQKAAAEDAKRAAAEDAQWSKGARSNAKK